MKTYYGGAERQRALSYWSIGSWGGSGICSNSSGGAVATTMELRMDFIFSIIVAILSMLLIKGTPETIKLPIHINLTLQGLIVLVVMLLSLNVVITKVQRGYTSLWFFG